MARLFISLYVFITLALIGLSTGLDRIFFSNQELSANAVYSTVIQAANQQNLDIAILAKNLKLKAVEKQLEDIAWSVSDRNNLLAGQVLSLVDPVLGEQLYVKTAKQMVLEISLPAVQQSSTQFFIYSIVFFLSLGGAIALWIWPLWRDLSSLQKTVSSVLPDGTIAENHISKHSLIAPIAQAINSMRSQINELIQAQRELSGAVAHEFRTPLARLKFALAMQADDPKAPWAEMHKDVNELELLVQEMLDYSSTGAHIPELSLSEIPIKELCQQLVQRLSLSHLQNLQVSVQGDDVNILADEHFIERAVANLLINGARYAKHTLTINIKKHNDTILINIEDDGEGVAESIREKIFSPFYRPDESRNRTKGGAGLGLAIVKRIVDWHQGKCYVKQSKLGGAHFVIQLPNRFMTIEKTRP
ncbi:ATP-binding protein [Paraglaciecola sp. L3A3]|uniref:ATP-binding protein n=1 Tax=Paraglaciecola sp. L3A3 TaxID=2686358 RepID=UPI00131A8936|nr:ATP-binding protein [Paraglaciecola sp. L3A3]